MKVSVIICTYSEDMFEHFRDALESVLSQTYEDVEVVVVVDGNAPLFDRIEQHYGEIPEVHIHCNERNVGLSESRNNALEYVTGDVVALLDDDAVADEHWISELVSVYDNRDAIAVGGKMTPLWVAGKPNFLPEEFYWLVGVTHRGFAEAGDEVRNTFGSNISFRTDVIRELGGFDPDLGRQGEKNLQAEETLLCVRMRERFGHGVIYNPDARVGHKVFEYRTRKRWLIERAFWQGYSKSVMKDLVTDSGEKEESVFLKRLFGSYVPERLRSLLTSPNITKGTQLVSLIALTAAVGFGYGFGEIKSSR